MTKLSKIVRMAFLGFFLSCFEAGASDGILFNELWKFHKGDVSGGESPGLNDSKWRELNLPHDWAIEGPFDVKYAARCGGLPFHGIGWYRKVFNAEDSWKGKTVRIAFDGAMNNAKIWINGHLVDEHPYGYTSFEVDLTQFIKFGEKNVISVKLSPQDLSSRWYPGAGIYRNVWLRVDNPVHVTNWGVFVSTPTVTKAKAVVQVQTTIDNKGKDSGNFRIVNTIVNAKGEKMAEATNQIDVKAGDSHESSVYMNLSDPTMWDLDNPYLYTMKTEVFKGDKSCDTYDTRFGIRNIKFKKEGFFLNDKKVRFNGVCLHHDNGPLGSAFNRRADERKLQIMKDMGVNAIRTSHNPPAPEFLDLCDEMGLLVLDEAFDEWLTPKVPNAYSNYFKEWSKRDLSDIIKRDRNHPSVIMWSIGNEILEQSDKKQGFTVAKYLADICREVDPSRPSTAGFNYYPAPFDNNIAQQIGVSGMNYKPAVYDEVQKNYPDLMIYGSETESCTSSRGVYHLPIEKYEKHKSLQVTSYDIIGPPWAYPPDIEFHFLEKNPNVMGEFMWTGFDYLGEPTPYGGKDNSTNGYWNEDWPSRSSYFGAVDLCGLPKDRFYLYQSQWTSKPMVHILPHWNWKKGMNIPVYVYTNCDEAELFLNGKSLGKRVKGKDLTVIPVDFKHYDSKSFASKYRLSWNVPFQEGKLSVKAYKNGKQVAQTEMNTAGKPYKLSLIPDRNVISADGKDLSYVTVRIEDKDGNLCPDADNLVNFAVSGAGRFKAVGNGNAATTESFISPCRKAFSGMCMLIVESESLKKGNINVTATSKGLRKQTILIKSE